MERTDAGRLGSRPTRQPGARWGVIRLLLGMRAKTDPPPTHVLAARQHGLVTRRQLEELGASQATVGRWATEGRLHRIHRGVYAVGHPVLTREARLMAAVLACGPDAVLSHRSAGELWGLTPRAGWVEVTTPATRARPGIRTHRAAVPAEHRTTRHRIPVTTPARTMIDLADLYARPGMERMLDQGEYLRLDFAGLEPVPGRRGYGRLVAILGSPRGPAVLTRTPLEDRFLAFVVERGLPRPEVDFPLDPYVADFAWPAARLIVETDGGSHRAAPLPRARLSPRFGAGSGTLGASSA